jgi:hypothetical protein
MINKLKYLFLLAICAGIFGNFTSVSAQANGQAYADRVIPYYEWLFETQFTSAQRSEYRQIKTEDFQKDPAGEKKSADDLLNNFNTIKSKNENEQAKVRGIVMNTFVDDLRGMTDSREAQLLLAVYDAKQAEDSKAASANGTGNISAYAGKWAWSRTGTGVVIGGVYAGGNGSRFTYEFAANGTVKFTGIMNVMQGGCSQEMFQTRDGKASVSGNSLTINWGPEKFSRKFSCDAANDYTKTLPAKVEKLKVNFKTNSTGQKEMCIVGAECYAQMK